MANKHLLYFKKPLSKLIIRPQYLDFFINDMAIKHKSNAHMIIIQIL